MNIRAETIQKEASKSLNLLTHDVSNPWLGDRNYSILVSAILVILEQIVITVWPSAYVKAVGGGPSSGRCFSA